MNKAEFLTKIIGSGRITIPKIYLEKMKLKKGDIIKVNIVLSESE